jgi:hypothetical protein
MRLRAPISTAVAVGNGLLLLVSLLFPGFESLRDRILGWAILLAAVAMLLGLVNLTLVHFNRIRQGESIAYSFILLAGLLITFVITLWQGRGGAGADWVFNSIQVPIETSLMALLAITLTQAIVRMVQQRNDLMSLIFAAVLLILLLGSAPLFGVELPIFTRSITPYINQTLSVGGARGLLLGVGLGTLLTGIRVLIGADRPYGG